MGLAGMYFLHFGKEYMHHGQIIADVDAANVLIKIDGCGHEGHMQPPMRIVPIAKMASKIAADGEIMGEWDFFVSRAELDAFLEHLKDDGGADDEDEESTSDIARAHVGTRVN